MANTFKQIWAVQVDDSMPASPGDVVTVTLKDGRTRKVTLGAMVVPGIFLAADDKKETTQK